MRILEIGTLNQLFAMEVLILQLSFERFKQLVTNRFYLW